MIPLVYKRTFAVLILIYPHSSFANAGPIVDLFTCLIYTDVMKVAVCGRVNWPSDHFGVLWTSASPSSQESLPPTQQAHPHCGQLTKLPQKEHFISICLSLAVHPHKFSLRRNGKQIGTLTREWLKRHSGCASGAAGYQSVCRSKQSVCFIIQCDTGAECARPAAGAVHQREH